MRFAILLFFITTTLFASCEKEPAEPNSLSFEAPKNLVPVSGSEFDTAFITISWDTVTPATRYELVIDTVLSFDESPLEYICGVNNYTINDSLQNNTYYFKVRAGNDTLWGDWSSVSDFTISVEVKTPEENIILADGESIKLLSSSQQFKFLEGPAFDGVNQLFFSDIDNSDINIYYLGTGSFQNFKAFSEKSNGLMFNKEGLLIACQGATGKIVALNSSGLVEKTIAATYNGVRFNSPNDLVIDSEGGIYFTDPTWSTPPQGLNGVYYVTATGEVTRLVDDMNKPNGVIFSPDGSKLYIDDSNSRTVRVYEIVSPGVLSDNYESILLNSNSGDISSADGLAMDVRGNLYVTTAMGIQVFDKVLKYQLTIQVPEMPANCTFGGEDFKTLFITARKNLYSIKLNNSGVTFPIK